MRLLELKLAGLKNYGAPARVRFSPGLTLLHGPIGSGKSALLDALLLALFGPQRGASERLDAGSLRAWSGGESYVSLEMEQRGTRHRVRWELAPEGHPADVRATLEQHDGAAWAPVSRDRRRVGEELRKLTRLDDLPTFAAVACVRQGDLIRVSRELTSVGAAAQRVFAGGVSGEEAVETLRKRMRDLLPRSGAERRPTNPREYERLEEKRDDLRRDLEEAEAQHGSFEGDAARLAELRAALPELRRRHKELTDLLGKEERRRELARRRGEIEGAVDEADRNLDRLEALEHRLKDTEAELRDLALPDGLDPGAEAGKLGELSQRRALLAEQLGRLEAEGIPAISTPRWTLACMAAGLLSALLGLVLGPSAWRWLLGLGVALVAVGAVGLLLARQRLSIRAQALGAERRDLAEQERKASDAVARLVDRLGADSTEEAERKLTRAGELVLARRGLISERQGVLGDKGSQALREKRRDLDRDLRQARLDGEEFAGFSPSAAEVERWRVEADGLAARVGEEEAERHRLEGGVMVIQDRLPSVAALRAELELVEGRMGQIERSHRANELALEVMEEARRELEAEYIPRLEERAQHYLGQVGRPGFEGPHFDGSPLRVRLSAPANPSVGKEALSFGEADLLYLSLRLAALEVLEGEDPLPFLLDDPLAHLDAESARKVRALLAERALRGQLIVTSFRSDDLEWARQLREEGKVPVAIYHFSSPGKPEELPAEAG
ncbi:MAG: AAA family ATPase [Nitrospinota bacterium]